MSRIPGVPGEGREALLVVVMLSLLFSCCVAAPQFPVTVRRAAEDFHGIPASLLAVTDLFSKLNMAVMANSADAQPPSQFSVSISAELNQTVTPTSIPTYTTTSSYTGSIVRDLDVGLVLESAVVSSLAPSASEPADLLVSVTADVGYLVQNNVCIQTDGDEFNMYEEITSIEYTDDEPCPLATGITGDCQVWSYTSETHEVTAYVYSMSEDMAVPVQLFYAIALDSITSTAFVLFTDYDTGLEIEDGFFDEPEVCNAPFYEPCGSIPQYGTIDLYMYSAEPPTTAAGALDLSNTYMADVHGTASWLCINGIGENVTADFPYVTRVTVTLDENWGIMSETGSGRVQRSGSQFYGDDNGGQCSGNEDIGSWYFMPEAGGCADEPTLRVNATCFWTMSTSVKTVSTDCLLSNGLFSSCTAEGYEIPFDASSGVLAAAFDAAEGEAGYCTDVVARTPLPTPAVPDDNDYEYSSTDSADEFEDGGDYWLAGIFTVLTLVLCIVALLLSVVAYKKKELIQDGLSQLSFMTKGPSDGFQGSEWSTLSEGGSNGLLDGDLMDDDDLDLTFD